MTININTCTSYNKFNCLYKERGYIMSTLGYVIFSIKIKEGYFLCYSNKQRLLDKFSSKGYEGRSSVQSRLSSHLNLRLFRQ